MSKKEGDMNPKFASYSEPARVYHDLSDARKGDMNPKFAHCSTPVYRDLSDLIKGNKINPKYTPEELLHLTSKSIKDIQQNVLDKDKNKDMIDSVQLLIMVINSSEYYAAMHYFSKSKAGTIFLDGNQYHVGKWGKIPASLVRQADSGYFGTGRSEDLARLSINCFPSLKFIVALGVCGTVGNIGDVVVSTEIYGCNDLKICGDDIFNRNNITDAGRGILNALMDDYIYWSFVFAKPEYTQCKSVAVFKPVLSGTPSIASGVYRDKLIKGVRKGAVAVEMEGIGVLEAIKQTKKRDKIEFVIVKAGCDYADESYRKEWQAVAAMAASDFLYKQLAKENVYEQFLMGLNHDICEVMLHAKENGLAIKARHSKVLFCGSSGVGKTNFINLLLGKDFEEKHISTAPAESHQLLAKQVVVKEQSNFEEFDYKKQIEYLKKCLHDKKYYQVKKDAVKPPDSNGYTTNPDEPPLLTPESPRSPSVPPKDMPTGKTTLTNPPETSPVPPRSEDMLPVMNKLANSDNVQSEEAPDVWDMLTFLDTGGQPEYISMLPAVNSSAMITFILHSVEGGVKRLEEDVKVVQDGNEEGKLSNFKYLDLIKMLFSMRKVKIEINQDFDKFRVDEKEGEKKCFLSLVGTKSDMLEKELRVELDKELTRKSKEGIPFVKEVEIKKKFDKEIEFMRKKLNLIIEAGGHEDSLIALDGECFLTVCNRNKQDPMGSEFRGRIYEYLQKRDVYYIPIVWLILELEILRRTTEEFERIIKFDTIKDICNQHHLIDEENIRLALQYFHHIGVFLYYDSVDMKDYVITDHKWVFENLDKLAKKAKNKGPVFKQMRLNGVLKYEAIRNINWNLNDKEIDYFLKLLEILGITSKLTGGRLKGYFLPSVLPAYCTANKQKLFDKFFGFKCKASSLIMQITYNGYSDDNCCIFPTGVFCYLINQLISHNDFKNGIQLSDDDGDKTDDVGNHCVFNNLVAFRDDKRGCYIVLINKFIYMEVELRQFDEHKEIKLSFFSEIRFIIESELKKACENLKLDVSKICIGFQHSSDGKFYYEDRDKHKNGNFPVMCRKDNNQRLPLDKDSEKNIWFLGISQPRDLQVIANRCTDKSISLSWCPPESHCTQIKEYVLQWKKTGTKFLQIQVKETETIDFELTGLTPNTEYHFKVAAIISTSEDHGSYSDSKYHGCFTDEISYYTRPSQPEQLIIDKTSITCNSLTLTWKPPSLSAGLKYRVEYKKTSDENYHEQKESLELTCDISDLTPNTEYHFRVSAFKLEGYWGSYKDTTQHTRPAKPVQLSVHQDENYKNEVTVTWKPPTGLADKYVVKYNKEGEEVYTSQETEDLTVKIDKLTAKDKYYFMVAAINESGQGDFTDKEYCQIKYLISEKKLRDEMVPKPMSISTFDKMSTQKIIDETKILIITANENEYRAVLHFLEPREPFSNVLRYCYKLSVGFISKELQYIFGRFGAFNVAVHILTSQGPAAAQSAITAASICFGKSLKAIFAVGVACGVDRNKINMLDVIVANKVTFYTEARLSSNEKGELEIKPRSSAHLNASSTFFQYFQQPPAWESETSDTKKHLLQQPRMHVKEILSGNFLIDNEDLKKQLINFFAPEAYGIEMECAGLFHDHDNHNVELMLIKAVCDFGDGKKSKGYQPTAALLAAECVHHYLSKGEVVPKQFTYTADSLKESISDIITRVVTKEEFALLGDEAQQHCDEVKLLLMTKSDNEFNAVLHHMAKRHIKDKNLGGDDIPKSFVTERIYFYIGSLAEIPAALVKLDQSSQSKEVSCIAMKRFANLKAIVSAGVCTTFGKRGDVIVSSDVLVDQHKEGSRPNLISQWLFSFLKAPGIWKFNYYNERSAIEHHPKIQHKPFVSLSTFEASQQLAQIHKDVDEIDMEGSGIVEAITEYKDKEAKDIHFIIVKASYEYADKEVHNSPWEPVAAMAAANLVYCKFDSPHPRKWFKEENKLDESTVPEEFPDIIRNNS